MKVTNPAANQTELTVSSGNVLFVSYETPVAAFIQGRGIVATLKTWSNTTSRHISKFHCRMGADLPISFEPQEFFDSLLETINLIKQS